MSRDWKMNLYRAMPVAIQEWALSAYAHHLDNLYYGPIFEQTTQEIAGRRFESPEAVKAWQDARLSDTLEAARRYVPYYRVMLADHPPIRARESLFSVPLLDKQQLRQREHEFLDERFAHQKLHTERTSGTTGTSLKISRDTDSLQKFWAAHEVRVRRAVGVDRFTPRAMLGGRPVVSGDTTRPPFWRYNRHWKQLYLSSYHISRRETRGYVEAIRQSGSVWMTGYGSAIAALAENAIAEGLAPLQLKAIVVSGDTLHPGMRRCIEDFFGCRCYDQYGQCEGVCWIMECSHRRMHVAPEFGILEILDERGNPCPPGLPGEMVATGLLNACMPLIRYKTGDEAAWAINQYCECGQCFPIVEKIEGRVDDYLVTQDGRFIGRLSTAMKGSPSIHSAQIVQDRPGHAYLLVKPGTSYRREDAMVVKADILSRIGSFSIDTIEVEDIPRTPAGKTRLVVRLAEAQPWHNAYQSLLGQRQEPKS